MAASPAAGATVTGLHFGRHGRSGRVLFSVTSASVAVIDVDALTQVTLLMTEAHTPVPRSRVDNGLWASTLQRTRR